MVGRSVRRGSTRADHERVVAQRLRSLSAELALGRASEPVVSTLPSQPTSSSSPNPGVPTPGRHAARGRLTLGPAHVAVVVIGVLVVLGAGGWWLVAGGSPQVTPLADPAPARDLVAVTDQAAPSTGSPTQGQSVTVDVAGRVRRPGIAVLEAGSRVVDALEAAGGVRAGVDLVGLNLARVLVDGEQILVGIDPPSGVAATAPQGAPVAALVNLNTADQVALESLPDVGPVTAQSILTWRAEHGAFTSVDQLLDVDGIGEATLAKLAPFVTL